MDRQEILSIRYQVTRRILVLGRYSSTGFRFMNNELEGNRKEERAIETLP
jgi:hypothetical protein